MIKSRTSVMKLGFFFFLSYNTSKIVIYLFLRIEPGVSLLKPIIPDPTNQVYKSRAF